MLHLPHATPSAKKLDAIMSVIGLDDLWLGRMDHVQQLSFQRSSGDGRKREEMREKRRKRARKDWVNCTVHVVEGVCGYGVFQTGSSNSQSISTSWTNQPSSIS